MRHRDLDWLSWLALCGAGLVLFLTWLGPRPSAGLGALNALAFWSAHVLPALALLGGVQLALGRIAPVRRLSGLWQVALAALIGAALFTPVALAVDAVAGAPVSRDDATEGVAIRAAQEFAQLAIPVTLFWGLVNAPSLIRLEGPQRRADGDGPGGTGAGMRAGGEAAEEFWARVPRRLGRSLVALSAELHYLRVHTAAGDALILFPFGRAVALLEGAGGLQVHRSHWVALAHVAEAVTGEGRMVLRMTGGLEIPVSRSCRPAVRAALGTSRAAWPPERPRIRDEGGGPAGAP